MSDRTRALVAWVEALVTVVGMLALASALGLVFGSLAWYFAHP